MDNLQKDIEYLIFNLLSFRDILKIGELSKKHNRYIKKKYFNYYYFFNCFLPEKRKIKEYDGHTNLQISMLYGNLNVFKYIFQQSKPNVDNYIYPINLLMERFDILEFLINTEHSNYLYHNSRLFENICLYGSIRYVKLLHKLNIKHENVGSVLYGTALFNATIVKNVFIVQYLLQIIEIFKMQINAIDFQNYILYIFNQRKQIFVKN